MMRILAGMVTFILSFSVHSTMYFTTDVGQNRLIVNSDATNAVYISNGKTQRLDKVMAQKEQIDNDGRPFVLALFANELCKGKEVCDLDMLGIISYSDSKGGLVIMHFDSKANLLRKEVVSSKNIRLE